MTARVLALAGILAVTLAPASVRGQELERLHVRSFDLDVDRHEAHVGEALHVLLDAKFGDPVEQLDNVTLPQLYGFDVLGDERSCSSTGTAVSECTERITIAPTRAGYLAVGPAVLEAIDATTGRPNRYVSNYVTVHVADGAAASNTDPFAPVFGPILRFGLGVLAAIVIAIAVFFTVMFLLARRLRAPSGPLPPPPPIITTVHAPGAIVPAVDPEVRFAALVRALDEEPTRIRVLALRAELRARAGARDDETLADLIGRGAGDERTRALLAVVERAAFVEDAFVPEAAREAVAQLRVVASGRAEA